MIFVVPAAIPLSNPDDEPIVAVPDEPELHVPPARESLKVVENVVHRSVVPVIAEGSGFTVSVVVAVQPVGNVYVIDVVPGVTPVTTPPADDIVATAVLELAHVPPVNVSLKDVVSPKHAFIAPAMTDGNGFTVTACVLVQPIPSAYVNTAVPAEIPETLPEPSILALALPPLHVPPAVASDKEVMAFLHTVAVPEIAIG